MIVFQCDKKLSLGGVDLHFSHFCVATQWRCMMAQKGLRGSLSEKDVSYLAVVIFMGASCRTVSVKT